MKVNPNMNASRFCNAIMAIVELHDYRIYDGIITVLFEEGVKVTFTIPTIEERK